MSLMPIYIGEEIGAGSIAAGVIISIAFAALAISTIIGGNVARVFHKRSTGITLSAFICIPSVWFMGQTTNIVVFTILFGMVWFFSGVQLVLTQIIAAHTSHNDQRGWIFGVLGTAGALAALIGGMTAGEIVLHWDYEALFLVCTIAYVMVIIASMVISDVEQEPVEKKLTLPTPKKPFDISQAIIILILASSVAHVASFIIGMARPLMMNNLNFDPSAITSVIAISGLISLPLPIVAGWLSDKFGRKPILIGAYLVTAIGAGLFLSADTLVQFWVAQAFFSVLACTMVVGTAFVMDTVSTENVDMGVSFFATTPWIGAVIGSTTGGFSMEYLGTTVTFEIAIALIIVAVFLSMIVRSERKLYLQPAMQA